MRSVDVASPFLDKDTGKATSPRPRVARSSSTGRGRTHALDVRRRPAGRPAPEIPRATQYVMQTRDMKALAASFEAVQYVGALRHRTVNCPAHACTHGHRSPLPRAFDAGRRLFD
ncbi:hypothetical protein GUJ93_ZPchr0007g5420 [Zizania palustris]|uniref:Uncharacterized protein n=1 Tax=Zizania palustris TaxID=103762 RepID=A0A8J5SSU7_ZIZPA|nr:hypothetical protein GUJ93_ZPchr0007g5420 [Zizania palustris]